MRKVSVLSLTKSFVCKLHRTPFDNQALNIFGGNLNLAKIKAHARTCPKLKNYKLFYSKIYSQTATCIRLLWELFRIPTKRFYNIEHFFLAHSI